MSWERVGHLATVFASLIAASALVIQLNESNSLSKNITLDKWKKTAVFTIVTDAGYSGTSLKQILNMYSSKVNQEFSNTPLTENELTQADVISILLELRNANMIYKSEDGTYKGTYSLDYIQAEETKDRIMSRIINTSLFDFMSTKSCKHTMKEVKLNLKIITNAEDYQLTALLNGHIGLQIISVNPDGKVCLQEDYNVAMDMQKKINEVYSQNQTQMESIKSFYEELNIMKTDSYKFIKLQREIFDAMKARGEIQ